MIKLQTYIFTATSDRYQVIILQVDVSEDLFQTHPWAGSIQLSLCQLPLVLVTRKLTKAMLTFLNKNEGDHNSDSPKPRKPSKHQKSNVEHKKELYKLAKLQNKLAEAVLKDATEAVHLPGPQMAKVPQKSSAEAAKKWSEGMKHHGTSKNLDCMDTEGSGGRGKKELRVDKCWYQKEAYYLLSIVAAAQDHMAGTRQNTNKKEISIQVKDIPNAGKLPSTSTANSQVLTLQTWKGNQSQQSTA
ncbi:hypothetical protein V8B97DRAFT_1918018 [Scleroderma yunnanense]